METTTQKRPVFNSIAEQNAWFAALPVEQQRVEIAKDVIAQEKAGVYVAHRGSYICVTEYDHDHASTSALLTLGEINQEFVLKGMQQCDVCHLGAAIVSALRLGNGTAVSEDMDSATIGPVITRWFGAQQAALMEIAFEGCTIGLILELPEGERPEPSARVAAMDFGNRYGGNTERSIAIWENVIKNNGEFIP